MRTTRFLIALVIVLSVVALPGLFDNAAPSADAQAAPTGKLAEVLERGRLICGVSGTLPGFSFLDPDTGEWSGFDVDYCRALAAAIFGEVTEDNLEIVALTAAERFTALQNGDVDVLFRNTTWTLSRDTDLAGDFGPTTFYDGQGLLVRVDLGVSSIDDLNGASFCTQTGTTTELNITDAMNQRGFDFELIPFETSADSANGYASGRCDVLTSDKSQLAGLRTTLEDPSAHVILPDTLSKEPLGPMYLQGDAQWGDVVNWTVFATFQAEEFRRIGAEITSENIDDFFGSDNPEIRRFLGEEGDLGSFLGLSNSFAADIIRAVGNYREIYERNIVPIGIEREGSLNAQWFDGGLIYAPAWR
ncbi:MAG: amino acid ABC transporter substrate-binding protein [Phototrophicales bacterium]|nr:MAG: amino acid ABC transporter substrate-binding protein [Phototrophicales bacterium]